MTDAPKLPSLPEGLVWEVSRNYGLVEIYPIVGIRREVTNWRGKKKTRKFEDDRYRIHSWGPQDGETVKSNIERLALKLAKRLRQNMAWEAEPDYTGTYRRTT